MEDERYPYVDDRVVAYADAHGLDAGELSWHLEAEHGWEPHDLGYETAIEMAAACLEGGGC